MIWAAGVVASSLAGVLAQRAGLEVDRAGASRCWRTSPSPVIPRCSRSGTWFASARPTAQSIALPGLAPVAMQEGRHAARVVRDRMRGRPARRFRYRDKGNLATIGRASAVAEIKGVRLSGFAAWVTWLTVHLWYLIGFENRLLVLIRWAFSFIAHGRGARLITNHPERATTASAERASPTAANPPYPGTRHQEAA